MRWFERQRIEWLKNRIDPFNQDITINFANLISEYDIEKIEVS